MLAIESVRRTASGLPGLTSVGLVVLVVGGLADVVAHLEVTGHAGHLHAHSASEASAHLIVFAGMVLILLGVVIDGARRARRPGRSAEGSSKGVA